MVNVGFALRAEEGSAARETYTLLDAGTTDYRRVARFRGKAIPPLSWERRFQQITDDPFTNLTKVNPAIDVYAVTADSDDAIDAYVQRMGLTVEVARDLGDFVQRHLYTFDRTDAAILVIDHKGIVRFAAHGPGVEAAQIDGAAFCVGQSLRARRKAK